MTQETEIVDVEPIDEPTTDIVHQPVGQVSIYRSMDPAEQLEEARTRAKILVEVVREQHLAKTFGQSTKPHVFVEGWQFLASQFGLIPDIEWTRELDNGAGWEARCALTRLSDGQVIAHADAECRTSEPNWSGRASYAVRSMAQTRAVSKVCRVALSSVMVMAGFSATPAEEVDGMTPAAPKSLAEPHCPACLDVHGALVAVTGPHDKKPYWRCTAPPQDCGGYRTYNGKEYSWSGWRTDFENSVAEYRNDVIKNDPRTAVIDDNSRTQRSGYIVHQVMELTGLVSKVDAEVLIKPGLVYAIEKNTVDAAAALGAKPGDPISDDELRIIIANLTLSEAEAVVAAAAAIMPEIPAD